ncbi:Alpha/Beta hydrolase protein [Butyriboletus roseoflavus]|nr:Alpha/Beta hydrolase protein [Butyriboletus roseoflavus]
MWLPDVALRFLGLSVQQPFAANSPLPTMSAEFALKASPDEVLSPQDMLTLPRPGAPLPNPAGDLALIPVSTYSFDDRKTHKSLAIAPIAGGQDPYDLSLPNGGDAFWLDARTIAHFVETEADQEKKQELFAIPVTFSENSISVGESISVGSLPVTTAADFRYAHSVGVLVFSAYVHADGDLKAVKGNDEKYDNRGNSALVYDKNFERQWDTWVGPKHKSLFTVRLHKDQGKFVLGEDFTNVLQGTELSSPVEPFGGTDDFDISDGQIIFTAKDPELPKAVHTKQNIYLVGFDGSNLVELTSGVHGATHAPAFSRQGDKVAWLQLDEDGHESDRAKVVIHDLEKGVSFTITQDWDRSPSSLALSESGDFIYLTAEDIARVKIFTLPIPPTPSESTSHPKLTSPYNTPVSLTDMHAASGLQVLSSGRLLFALSSLTSPNDAYVLGNLQLVEEDVKRNASNPVKGEITQITKFSATSLQGKHLHPGEDFWFKGAEHTIHGWILTPPGYKSTDVKKWPVVLLIHGGPEGCWADSWSTRWNPNVFANQGYVVVAINPTGSTSFGQDLTEGIKEDWGGKPFVDLRNGWKYVLENYPQIDPERAVAAGASYGGYAINWIQGNPEFGFGFKALVCHDGVFDTTYNGYATDELFFFNHEWGGRPWEEKSFALSRKYSPAYTVSKWSTPQLIIHGSKDYRLPEGDGLAVWHALQQLGVPSRLVIFPDENHWVMNAGNSLKWHYEVFKWFDEFVGDNASVRQRN